MEKVQVPAKLGRLVHAVASIGYDPEVALCDLMDNCVDAGADQIDVNVSPEIHEQEGQTDTIHRYVIADDGCGMNGDQLVNAFTLGSARDYPPHSLGKFGLGLKSAGLSLGDRIAIVSKTAEMSAPLCAVLSMMEVQETGEYEIDLGEPPDNYQQLWEAYSPGQRQGTIVVLEELNESQPAYSAFLSYFRRYCSNLYHMFIEDEARSLSIRVNEKKLSPIDPLFMSKASENGPLQNPLEWDGRTPHVLISHQELALSHQVACSIAATHLVHPPSYEEYGTHDEMRSRYQVDTDPYTRRGRHGFYVYRNRRIIAMAERFHGLISNQTQAWAFRGRLVFDENADDVLSLDVKKRHLQLPKTARNNLKNIISPYQAKSTEAWRVAGRRVSEWKRETKEEKANESIAKAPVASLEYTPGAAPESEQEIEARKERQKEIGDETLASIQDGTVTGEVIATHAANKNIVVEVEGLKGNAMWLPYPAVELGMAETIINKSHSWLSEAYAAAEDDARITLVLHQLFTVLARAELEVRSTPWQDVTNQVVEKVLDRFRRKASAIGEDLAEALGDELKKIAGETITEE